MLNLFDTYNQLSWDLHFSIFSSGYEIPTVVIEDDGFLPHDVTSPIQYFTGVKEQEGRPLYFNELALPPFWEMTANSQEGEIFNLHKKMGHVYFDQKTNNRFVKEVDWFDEAGRLRFKDKYNNLGYRFARTTYTESGQEIQTAYFKANQEEVLVENHLSGDLILNHLGQVMIFKDKGQFVRYYLETAGYDLGRVFYNSLSTPLFVAFSLPDDGHDILFWNEPIGDSIPGNMMELLLTHHRNTQIVVQDKEVYHKILSLVDEQYQSRFHFLGYLYPFKRTNEGRRDVFTLTNSDQLQDLAIILEQNPKLTFHIAAVTEMSEHLMSYGKYPNIKLYPNISPNVIDHLFNTCDLYLDINYGNELPRTLRTAFENRMPILAFDSTCHNHHYVAKENLFARDNVAGMNAVLNQLSRNKATFKELLKYQREGADVATKAQYRDLIN